MSTSAAFRIWRHQCMRVVRHGSLADTVLAGVARGGMLIGAILFGLAFLVLLPAVGGQVVAIETLAAVLEDYLFAAAAVVLMANVWISTRESLDLFRYRSYPVSLAGLALVVQLTRAVHPRYLTLGLAATVFLVLASRHVAAPHVIVAGLLILLLDSLTLLLQAFQSKHTWIFHAMLTAVFAVTLFDVLGGHRLSEHAFRGWMRSMDMTSYSFWVLLALTSASALASHRRIRSLLRYGS